MTETAGTPKLYTVQEVAEALRVHYRTAYRLITGGSIEGIKIGKQWRVKEQTLLDYLEGGWKDNLQQKKRVPRGPKQLMLPLEEE